MAAAVGEGVGAEWLETQSGVRQAARGAAPAAVLSTQGLRLRLPDLLTTLAVEACVHHLDLLVGWPGPQPAAAAMAVCRMTLDGLLGEPCPFPWDDATFLRHGTGREPLTDWELDLLGDRARLFPLFS